QVGALAAGARAVARGLVAPGEQGVAGHGRRGREGDVGHAPAPQPQAPHEASNPREASAPATTPACRRSDPRPTAPWSFLLAFGNGDAAKRPTVVRHRSAHRATAPWTHTGRPTATTNAETAAQPRSRSASATAA